MSRPRFLLDEHVDRGIQRRLRRLNPAIDVICIGEHGAPAAGTVDPDLLRWIEEQGYLLVTGNRKTMPGHLAAHHAASRHVPGIFLLRPRLTISAVVQALHLIWQASDIEEYRDQLRYLPL